MAPTAEYETFQYKHFDEPALTLDEAVEEARRLRRSDKRNVYRVIPIDQELSGFRVESLPAQKVYGDLLARLFKDFFRNLSPGR